MTRRTMREGEMAKPWWGVGVRLGEIFGREKENIGKLEWGVIGKGRKGRKRRWALTLDSSTEVVM